MTKEEMIELAKQSGWEYAHGESGFEPLWAFAKLIAKRKWVGLTDEEKHEIRYSHMTSAEFIEFIEAKLKEKNKCT